MPRGGVGSGWGGRVTVKRGGGWGDTGKGKDLPLTPTSRLDSPLDFSFFYPSFAPPFIIFVLRITSSLLVPSHPRTPRLSNKVVRPTTLLILPPSFIYSDRDKSCEDSLNPFRNLRHCRVTVYTLPRESRGVSRLTVFLNWQHGTSTKGSSLSRTVKVRTLCSGLEVL